MFLNIQRSVLIRKGKLLEVYLSRSSEKGSGPSERVTCRIKIVHLEIDPTARVISLGEIICFLSFTKQRKDGGPNK